MALALLLPACVDGDGTGGAASPVTIGNAPASAEEANDAIVVARVAGEGPSEVAEVIGPPLEAGASAENILDIVADLHGPTNNLASQMERLVPYPAVPTPPGADIREVRADVRDRLDGEGVIVTSEVLITAAGTADELIGFFVDAFGELGWESTGRSQVSTGPMPVERLTYAVPGSGYDRDDVVLLVSTEAVSARTDDDPAGPRRPVTADGGDDRSATARLRLVELRSADEGAALFATFGSWYGELPLPEGGDVTGASVQTSDLSRYSLHLSSTIRYDVLQPEELSDALRAGLPAGGFEIAPAPSMGPALDTWVYLDHPFFAEARVSPHALGEPPRVDATLVNVYARSALYPALASDAS